MKLKFTKMHGCGNDYIYIDCFSQTLENPEELSIALSRPHFGIGADGIILICPSDIADAKMRIFNQDGSEGKMCGNGIRCVGKYLYDSGRIKNKVIFVETLSGVKRLELHLTQDKVDTVTVNMGKAELASKKLPVLLPYERVINKTVIIGENEQKITCVSMGNPHCVVFRDSLENLAIEEEGQQFEFSPLFPERVNTEFIRVLGTNELQMRVWERGSGETLACGTGACAAAVAAVENGFCSKNEDICVHLRGGDLTIRYTEDAVFMTGKAQTVFYGEIEL